MLAGMLTVYISALSAVPLAAPRDLRVSEEWYDRLRITWDPAPFPTLGYSIVYQPSAGRSRECTPSTTVGFGPNSAR